MKRIVIDGFDFNRVMRVCTPSLSEDTSRKPLMHILIECNGEGIGCATSLDGFVLAQTRFSCKGDACKILIFPLKKVKDDLPVVIEYNGTTVSISSDGTTITKTVPNPDTYVNHTKITKGAQEKQKTITVAFNPTFMSKIIKSHKDHSAPILFDIYGENDPIVVHTEESVGLLLPIRVMRERNMPEFWEMIANGD